MLRRLIWGLHLLKNVKWLLLIPFILLYAFMFFYQYHYYLEDRGSLGKIFDLAQLCIPLAGLLILFLFFSQLTDNNLHELSFQCGEKNKLYYLPVFWISYLIFLIPLFIWYLSLSLSSAYEMGRLFLQVYALGAIFYFVLFYSLSSLFSLVFTVLLHLGMFFYFPSQFWINLYFMRRMSFGFQAEHLPWLAVAWWLLFPAVLLFFGHRRERKYFEYAG